MTCDMCGANTKLFRTEIESTEMCVCRECSKFGKVLGEVKPKIQTKKESHKFRIEGSRPAIMQVIVEDYSEKIKKARENLKLKQKEFAQKINEKESVVHKLETGNLEPNFQLARKLEKFLKIRLVEQQEDTYKEGPKVESDSFTLGDFIKIKKK